MRDQFEIVETVHWSSAAMVFVLALASLGAFVGFSLSGIAGALLATPFAALALYLLRKVGDLWRSREAPIFRVAVSATELVMGVPGSEIALRVADVSAIEYSDFQDGAPSIYIFRKSMPTIRFAGPPFTQWRTVLEHIHQYTTIVVVRNGRVAPRNEVLRLADWKSWPSR